MAVRKMKSEFDVGLSNNMNEASVFALASPLGRRCDIVDGPLL